MSALSLPHGLHRDVEPEVYFARELACASNSGLQLFARSALKYRHWVEHGESETTDALELGRAVHCAVLEPARFDREYIAEPDFGSCRANQADGTTKEQGAENKKRRDEWRAAHPDADKLRLTFDQATTIRGMVASVLAHPRARLLIEDGMREVTVRWRDPRTGVECKGRIDHLNTARDVAVDLKSCLDASPSGFAKSIGNYGYHHQDDFYRAGLQAVGRPSDFTFVACEKAAPYDCAVYELDAGALEIARATNAHRLAAFARCLATNEWPGLPVEIQTLSLKPWVTE